MQPGKMNEIAAELNKFELDMVALQEIRWKGFGIIRKRNYTLYYSGDPGKSEQMGTGFWVNRKNERQNTRL